MQALKFERAIDTFTSDTIHAIFWHLPTARFVLIYNQASTKLLLKFLIWSALGSEQRFQVKRGAGIVPSNPLLRYFSLLFKLVFVFFGVTLEHLGMRVSKLLRNTEYWSLRCLVFLNLLGLLDL